MFGPTSPVAELPRPAPKLKAMDIICDTPDSSITLSKLNLTVYVAGNAGLLEAAISNDQFIQIQIPQTFNSTLIKQNYHL